MSYFLATGKIESSCHKPIILFHGGAGPSDPKGKAARLAAKTLRRIANEIQQYPLPPLPLHFSQTLITTSAENIALRVAFALEEAPCFNAGFGAALQADGVARVSASFMESVRQKFSAVINGIEILHPSELAFYLQHQRFCVLDPMGTQSLARELGIPRNNLVTPKRLKRWLEHKKESSSGKTGTIGCVVWTPERHLAATTSTGGVGNETPGRVGDTPTVAGNYCTSRVSISCTGYGEQILNAAVAPSLATRVHDGLPLKEAAQKVLQDGIDKGYGFAFIAIAQESDQTLSWVAGSTESYFVWAGITPDGVLCFDTYEPA